VLSRRLPAGGVLLVVAALWEISVRFLSIPEFLLPAPSRIATELWRNRSILGWHTTITVVEVLGGFAVGGCFGFGLALLMDRVERLRHLLYPIVIATQTTPKIAIAPLIIVWFGVGIFPKLLIVALLAFFPILINTLAGLESVDRNMIDLMRSIHATDGQIYRHVRVPAAIPYIFAGLKLSATVSVIGAIVAEWVASYQGLGYLLLYYNSTLDIAKTFAAVFILVVLGILAFASITFLERKVSWEMRVTGRRATGRTTRPESATAESTL
jgi:NitT/TauT family transport system permease protein